MVIREIVCPLPPEELFARLSHRPGCFYLDSACNDHGLGGHSFLGFEPYLIFESKGSRFKLTTPDGRSEERHGDPLVALRDLLRQHRPKPGPATLLPFIGGAVGGFSYELCTQLERLNRTSIDDLSLPDIRFGFYDGFFAFDHGTGRTWLVANPTQPADDARIVARLEQALVEALRHTAAPKPAIAAIPTEPQSNFTKQAYVQAIVRIKDYILAGDVYQVNLTQRFETTLTVAPAELYRRLRARSPASFSCYLDWGDWQVVGSSPERFLRIRDRRVETRPIKGTRPRGLTVADDARLRAELLASEKDRAELLMIVDLKRNDLGRVCEYGSIRVDDLYHLETHPTVFHLVANVSGQLRADADMFDCLRAAFPGGSITGAPKIRAMQIIDELEPHRRHFYTGAVGYLGYDGNCDLNIAIRTIFCSGQRAWYHVGGGIVWDSDPQAEYQETLDKGRALRAALIDEIP